MSPLFTESMHPLFYHVLQYRTNESKLFIFLGAPIDLSCELPIIDLELFLGAPKNTPLLNCDIGGNRQDELIQIIY